MNFYETISAAIRDMTEHGFDSLSRVEYWLKEIKEAAQRSMIPEDVMERHLRETFYQTYRRQIERGGILRNHPTVSLFDINKVKPHLHAELERRIVASSSLIKLNRSAMIEKTMQRFSGWATSIPLGGSEAVNKRDENKNIRKALSQLPFEERRVAIDQGHKFVAALNEIIATDNNAIACTWHSRWRELNYNYRKDHKERDGKVYAIRGCWAIKDGYMKSGNAGYYDDITKVGEEVYCRCSNTFLYSLKSLPRDMLTAKGEKR